MFYYAQTSIGPMRPRQARKEKSQEIRKVEGRIIYGRDGSSGDTGTVSDPPLQLIPDTRSSHWKGSVAKFIQLKRMLIQFESYTLYL